MIKKFFITLFIFFTILTQVCFAQSARLTNITFDNSDNFIFFATNSKTENFKTLKIKPIKLTAPDRVYFDIENFVLTQQNTTYYFKNTDIQTVKIAQFSTNPDVVRVVITYNENFNPDKIKFTQLNNNLLILNLNDKHSAKNNLSSVFRTQNAISSDYYEKTVYAPQDKVQQITNGAISNTSSSNPTALEQIQKAIQGYVSSAEMPLAFNLDRQFELKTNYFLKRIDIKKGNALISGIGNIEIENPFTLSNPSRLVIDLPNTVVSEDLRNKEFDLTEKDTIKIGQFEQSKARIVITTQEPQMYVSMLSLDKQSLLIASEKRLLGLKLADENASLLSLKSDSNDNLSEVFNIKFSKPVIHSVKKEDNNFEISFYNLINVDEAGLKKAAKNTKNQTLKIDVVPYIESGLKLIFPIKKNTSVNVYKSANSRDMQINIVNKKQTFLSNANDKNSRKIVIDPGHGGSDMGAIRNNVNEKDINLKIALLVEKMLKDKGYDVELTMTQDTTMSLQERVDFGIQRNADIFVSIHANTCANEAITGIETHYYKDDSIELAKTVHKSLMKYVKTADRGLFKSKFYVINHSLAPSILIETGFISNTTEREELTSNKRQENTAKAITEGIINYLSGKS